MSKITQTPSARSYADKMAYYSLVSQIKRYLPMKMKMGPFFSMASILFLMSLQLVACSFFGPPPAATSATATTTASSTTPGATPGTTPPVVPGTTPGATPPVAAGATPPVAPGTTPPVVPGTTPPVAPGTTPPVAPGANPTVNPNLAFAPGNLTFDGTVKNTGASSVMSLSILQTLPMSDGSIVVSMPDGNSLSMIVTSKTDLSDFDDELPSVGAFVKVKAVANADGSFTAAKLSHGQQDDPKKDVISYQGVTTSAVGTDHVIHFKVGRKSYTFTIPSSADLGDFHGNAQSIHANQAVKVEVRFKKSKGTVIKVGNAGD